MPTPEDAQQDQHTPEPYDEEVPPELAERLSGLRRTAILAGLVVGATVLSSGYEVPTISFA